LSPASLILRGRIREWRNTVRKTADVFLFKSYVLKLPSRESQALPVLSSTVTEPKCTSTCLISLQPRKLRKSLYAFLLQISSDVTKERRGGLGLVNLQQQKVEGFQKHQDDDSL